ncbi:hypothetical protein H0W26_02460 [Candidatus Dependentiae bacterium]|nr:hypothetical protein [Candidatus Dependentiae bacterium]
MQKHLLSIVCVMSLTLMSISFLEGSDLHCISSFTKEEKKVYLLGMLTDRGNEADSPIIPLYKTFLHTLSLSSTQAVCILPASKKSIKKIATKETYYDSTSLYGLTLHDAADCNFQSGSLQYTSWEYSDDIIALESLYELLYCYLSVEVIKDICQKCKFPESLVTSIIAFLDKPSCETDPFFKNKTTKKYFTILKKVLIEKAGKMFFDKSLYSYLNLLKAYGKKCRDFSENKLISSLKKQWLAARETALCYVQTYSVGGKESKLIEILLKVIEKKESYLAGLEEFQLKVFSPLTLLVKIEECLLLLKSLTSHSKIIAYSSFFDTKTVIQLLQEEGFEGNILGIVPQDTEMVSVSTRSFSNSAINTHLTSIVHDTFNVQNSNNTLGSFTYYDAQSNTFVTESPKDHALYLCSSCHLAVQGCKVFIKKPTTLYCSLGCLLTTLLKKEETPEISLSLLLTKSYTLSDSEKLIVNQFGALCYLRAALLMPSFGHEQGIVYQLPLSKIIKCLEGIVHCPDVNKPDTWKATLDLCSAWNIDIGSLKTSLQVYAQLKKNYLQDLLKKRSKNLSYDTLSQPSETTFSENKFFEVNQQSAFTKLKTAFDFLPSTDNTSLLFIYRELVNRIHKRVGLNFSKIEDLLAITYNQQDLKELVDFMGYEENPLMIRQRPSRGLSEQESCDEQSSDEEEPEKTTLLSLDTSHEQSLLVSDLTNETGFKTMPSRNKKVHVLQGSFMGCKPYTITLFKAQRYVSHELKDTHTVWKTCKETKESQRIQLLFALAHEAEEQQCSVYTNGYGCLASTYTDENCHESLREKLDIHHLFSRTVDSFLRSYGIVERIDTLIQISFPGELAYDTTKEIGFFQYSFTPEWVCIHRCFKPYDVSSTDKYVTIALRKMLYDFLRAECQTSAYAEVIEKLKQLV